MADDQIDQMASQFKTLAEVKAYSSAQHSTIVKLNAKIKDLNEEIASLKNILSKSTPLLESDSKGLLINPFEMSNEEMICLVQLNRLKEISDDRLFTKEEAQQLDIFTKSLNLIRNSPKTIRVETAKELTEGELIALIEKTDESSS